MEWRAILLAAIALPLCLNAELLPIRSYTTADGLASDEINSIHVDSRGFVWFCTQEGLSRFDGYRFVNFGVANGLPARGVNALLETHDGNYLVATDGGLCQFNGKSQGAFATYYVTAARHHGNGINALLQDAAGRIWCGTNDGVYQFLSDHTFRRIALPAPPHGWTHTPISNLAEDTAGKLWAASPIGLYVVAKQRATQRLGKEDGLPDDWVETLLFDTRRRLWAGTRAGLALFSDNGMQQVYVDNAGIHLDVKSLAEGRDQRIWAGTTIELVRSLPGESPMKFKAMTRAQELTGHEITALSTDRAGNMWAGTNGSGAMKIQRAGFTAFHEQDGLASEGILAVMTSRAGAVVAVSVLAKNKSINVFDGNRFHSAEPKVFGRHPSWALHQILLESRNGEWWAATARGLCRYPAVRAEDLARTTPACYARETEIFRVFEDSKGGIWASGQTYAQGRGHNQLMRWNPATQTLSSFESEVRGLVNPFAEDTHGDIWMGYWGGGLLRYNGREFRHFGTGEGAPRGLIRDLFVDSAGRLWIGSEGGGLGMVATPAADELKVRTYSTADGLASDIVRCLVEDKQGRMYAGTAKGVDRLDPVTGRIKHFSGADGLPYGRLTSAVRDPAGNLWFGTLEGLAKLTPLPEEPLAVPAVRITELRVGRQRYPISQLGETFINRGDLPPRQNEVQFEFVGLSDEPEGNLRYKYELEGGDSEWQGPSRDHQVNYAELEAGSYRFLVEAINSDGRASVRPAEVDFVILPPIWRRWWFEGLGMVCAACLIFTVHRYRVAQAVQIERMRTSIATDLHDDIGASLSQIAILSEVARGHGDAGQEARGELERVATLARELVDSMSDIVWSIRAVPDGVDSLLRRMREFANDLLESRAIAFELRTPSEAAHFQLGLQTRRELFLIFKECLNNASRHSGCTNVKADLVVEGREIVLCVRDNGCGLHNGSQAPTRGGAGMPNLRKRAQSLGGQVKWTSGPEGGCRVEARLPLQ